MSRSPTYAWFSAAPLLDRLLPRPLLRERLVTGILVTGTARSPVVYVTSSDPRVSSVRGPSLPVDTNSGVISRLTRTDSGWRRVDLVRGLPRSRKDHATNGMALDGETQTLFVAQGGNTNKGAPSHAYALLPEYALSGGVLAVDLTRIGDATYDLPTLDDDERAGSADENDPFGGNGGQNQARLALRSPVRVFAAGFRNPYDLVLTRLGRLYTVDNGANAGWGARPARCTNEVADGGKDDAGTLHLIAGKGYYGGHANPTRGSRENLFGGRSPVDVANQVECRYRPPRLAGALATFTSSTNGVAEYTASSFGGSMRGELLTASLDGSIYRVRLDSSGRRARVGTLFAQAGTAPLDVTTTSDGESFPGTIWVADYNGHAILVFEPGAEMRGSAGEPDFRRGVLAGTTSRFPTSLQFGPDGRLYVGQHDGLLRRYSIVRHGPGQYAVVDTETITEIQDIPNHDDDGRRAARLLP